METKETYLGGCVSVYLHKGRFGWRTIGVYATTDRIIGVRLGWAYLLFTNAPLTIAAGIYLAAFYLSRGFPTGPSLLFLLLAFLPLLSMLGGILFHAIAEMTLKHRAPLTIEEIEAKKYFEVRRDQVSEILLKRNTAFTPGSLTIEQRLGETIKVFILGYFGTNERCLYGLIHLMESFCAKSSMIRAPNMVVWTL